jgi:tetratricopeptide (TPR) repeat protein
VEMRELHRIETEAKQQAEKTNSPADRQRAEQAKREIDEKELELYRKRVERYPNNLQYRAQFADRLKKHGMYNEAIAEYQTARNDPKYRGLCLLALGQCFQKIKKYQLAMKHYEEAIEEIADRDVDNKKKALYLAGRLAAAMKNFEAARRYLNTLAGMDFSYKDVSQLLDKLDEFDKNGGAPEGNEQ